MANPQESKGTPEVPAVNQKKTTPPPAAEVTTPVITPPPVDVVQPNTPGDVLEPPTTNESDVAARVAQDLAAQQATINGEDIIQNNPSLSKSFSTALETLRAKGGATKVNLIGAQTQIYHGLILSLTDKNPDNTKKFLDKFLTYANLHLTGHFKESWRFREFPNLNLDVSQIEEFKNILGVLLELANPMERRAKVVGLRWEFIQASIPTTRSAVIIGRLKDYFNVV